jgi:hypothetical protein
MHEPPSWIQAILYVAITLAAIWVGVRLAWWLAGMSYG